MADGKRAGQTYGHEDKLSDARFCALAARGARCMGRVMRVGQFALGLGEGWIPHPSNVQASLP